MGCEGHRAQGLPSLQSLHLMTVTASATASSSPPLALRAQGLSKAYTLHSHPWRRLRHLLWRGHAATEHSFWALREVSFALPRGEVLGVVGRNGAGKSTLLQLLCGTLQPSAGTLEVRGRVAALLELGAGFNPDFSGRENVFMNAAILGIGPELVRERFEDIVAFAGLQAFIDQPVRTYSSGMYMRLAFSVATAFEPDILIIDEALSVGDGAFARKSFDRIMALKERGATILFCSHSMFHIEAICTQALWLEAGRVQLLDEPQRVTRAYQAALDGNNGAVVSAAPAPAMAAATAAAMPETASDSTMVTGQARLLQVRCTQPDGGVQVPLLQSGLDTLALQVDFVADPLLPAPAVGVVIETAQHQTVFSTSTALDGVVLQRNAAGSGQAQLQLPALPLMTGSYWLSVFLTCERTLHVYDHATHCLRFEVCHSGPHQGLVFLPRRWNQQTVPVVPVSAANGARA